MTRSLLDARERIAGAGIRAGDDAEVEAEEGPQFPLPVADQPGRRDDQDAAEQAAGEHLADVEPGHDRLARARLVRPGGTEAGLGEHVVVDGDPLVGQRVDQRDFGRERRVEEVAVGRAAPPRRRLGPPRGRIRRSGKASAQMRSRFGTRWAQRQLVRSTIRPRQPRRQSRQPRRNPGMPEIHHRAKDRGERFLPQSSIAVRCSIVPV